MRNTLTARCRDPLELSLHLYVCVSVCLFIRKRTLLLESWFGFVFGFDVLFNAFGFEKFFFSFNFEKFGIWRLAKVFFYDQIISKPVTI